MRLQSRSKTSHWEVRSLKEVGGVPVLAAVLLVVLSGCTRPQPDDEHVLAIIAEAPYEAVVASAKNTFACGQSFVAARTWLAAMAAMGKLVDPARELSAEENRFLRSEEASTQTSRLSKMLKMHQDTCGFCLAVVISATSAQRQEIAEILLSTGQAKQALTLFSNSNSLQDRPQIEPLIKAGGLRTLVRAGLKADGLRLLKEPSLNLQDGERWEAARDVAEGILALDGDCTTALRIVKGGPYEREVQARCYIRQAKWDMAWQMVRESKMEGVTTYFLEELCKAKPTTQALNVASAVIEQRLGTLPFEYRGLWRMLAAAKPEQALSFLGRINDQEARAVFAASIAASLLAAGQRPQADHLIDQIIEEAERGARLPVWLTFSAASLLEAGHTDPALKIGNYVFRRLQRLGPNATLSDYHAVAPGLIRGGQPNLAALAIAEGLRRSDAECFDFAHFSYYLARLGKWKESKDAIHQCRQSTVPQTVNLPPDTPAEFIANNQRHTAEAWRLYSAAAVVLEYARSRSQNLSRNFSISRYNAHLEVFAHTISKLAIQSGEVPRIPNLEDY